MAQVDADPLDGPEIDTSDPAGTAMGVVKYMVGAGVFFALLAAAQSTVTPLVQSGLDAVPGVDSGSGEAITLGANGGGL